MLVFGLYNHCFAISFALLDDSSLLQAINTQACAIFYIKKRPLAFKESSKVFVFWLVLHWLYNRKKTFWYKNGEIMLKLWLLYVLVY
jgi:hypothetical protein